MDTAKKKPSRKKPVVVVRGAARSACDPRPHRMRNKPVAYADGHDSKSDKASPYPRPFFRGICGVHHALAAGALLCMAGLGFAV